MAQRQSKPPGDCSTMGSLIYGNDTNQPSYLDERKTRRCQSDTPEQSNPALKTADSGAGEIAYYAHPSAAQELRDRFTIAPGSVSREHLQQFALQAKARRGNYSGSRSDYFANGMGGPDGENNPSRRTRRMFEASSGSSSFQLG